MTTETQELKACPNPWCGEKQSVAKVRDVPKPTFRVICKCGVMGPMALSEAKAITAWNTRPREEALEAEVVALRAQVRAASEAAQVVWSGEHARLEAEVGRLRNLYEGKRYGDATQDVLQDSAWIAGAKFASNCLEAGNRGLLLDAINRRIDERVALSTIRASREGEGRE
ncbi:Lar family restriction alleviation protein [Phenylobacterium conjunctum]|uniref:Lar family restriction alleviation protein n=1 Tax=Phenylobacterium conjunctum TaxID=1298959 RepID=A0ABW3SYJ4_9CAUL